MIENFALNGWKCVGNALENLRGEKTAEELDENSRCFSLSEIEGMIAELESALAAGGKHAKFCLQAKSAPFEDAAGLHCDALWEMRLFPGVDLLVRLACGPGGAFLDVPVFCEDIRWWMLNAAHAAMLELGAGYSSSADFPKCASVDQLVKPSRIAVRSLADWPSALSAVKLAVSHAVDIAKFRVAVDERLSAAMAAVSSKLRRLNAELRETYDCVAALHKKSAALWDIVCPESAGT